jgi:hypothetical protein
MQLSAKAVPCAPLSPQRVSILIAFLEAMQRRGACRQRPEAEDVSILIAFLEAMQHLERVNK